jgi:hypothetical protein
LAQALVVLLLIAVLRHPPLLLQHAGTLVGEVVVVVVLAVVALSALALLVNAALLVCSIPAVPDLDTAPIVRSAQLLAALLIRNQGRALTLGVPALLGPLPATLGRFALVDPALLAQHQITLPRFRTLRIFASSALIATQAHLRLALCRLAGALLLLEHGLHLLARLWRVKVVGAAASGAQLRLALDPVPPHVLPGLRLPCSCGAVGLGLGLHLDSGPFSGASALFFRAFGILLFLRSGRHHGSTCQGQGNGKCAEGLRTRGESHLDALSMANAVVGVHAVGLSTNERAMRKVASGGACS